MEEYDSLIFYSLLVNVKGLEEILPVGFERLPLDRGSIQEPKRSIQGEIQELM